MKRLLCLVAVLCLVTTGALAQAATEATPLTGETYYPDGATADTATYIFRYTCPQFAPDTEADRAINTYFASLAQDMAVTPVPDGVADSLPDAGMPAYYTTLDYSITASTDDHLSVLFTSRQFLGNAETESWTAVVMARSGVYAGQPISLSQAMGLETDEDAQNPDISYASELVYGLVWQIIQQQEAMSPDQYFPELTKDDLETAFSPESDFYFDENDNFVFFIQSGQIASEVNGILTYPFSLAELLSAV